MALSDGMGSRTSALDESKNVTRAFRTDVGSRIFSDFGDKAYKFRFICQTRNLKAMQHLTFRL